MNNIEKKKKINIIMRNKQSIINKSNTVPTNFFNDENSDKKSNHTEYIANKNDSKKIHNFMISLLNICFFFI